MELGDSPSTKKRRQSEPCPRNSSSDPKLRTKTPPIQESSQPRVRSKLRRGHTVSGPEKEFRRPKNDRPQKINSANHWKFKWKKK